MTELNNRQSNRFDILRLLAAWLVLFSHCYPLGGWPGHEPLASTLGITTLGGLGVAMFFVLSGFLVTLSIHHNPSLLAFARRRALRIYPGLLVACLMAVLVFGLVTTHLPWSEYLSHPGTREYLKTASALTIRYSLPGVFETNFHSHAVNGSLWSLPYEINCYFALMLLTLLPLPLRFKSLLVLAVLAVVMLVRPLVPPATAWEKFLGLDFYDSQLGVVFALGSACAFWRRPVTLWWLGPVLMCAAIVLLRGNVQALVFLVGFCLFVLWLGLNALWLPALPERMGDWSYGTYLYGFPVQQLLVFFDVPALGLAVFVLSSTLLTLLLAAASWYAIEKPAMRWK